ncbi:leucine-rich repeat domain-containing protein [Leptospira borgpetersenii]|uniref:Leucine rich repeat protein n=2 Tax=Leptospira borgpetersenii serovar Hardjo-bovis TaxID=338217 RepID=M6BLF6_LEPBO|nr:leucine-rich repeat domain-containing protein [Leptospira borgpetersenii]EMJ80379.1 leucine rich repeat protein [Leptospira borgpetersenii serovar Hardjo-bovis str. Sponselee]MBE8350331.1 leucine-rich repeat domain-containing protein [Leptospira borgpetersenii serovar Hardjo-bovis]MBE8360754.1 leucine-rich repeat domain-containing protein [Leptospira borgpetersenii serovar Hardjo-bovis]MBE8370405.1 leucine-rich repeat domain-containing protein [Leptospira borgpetersenii serovar Hardjo-bovis]
MYISLGLFILKIGFFFLDPNSQSYQAMIRICFFPLSKILITSFCFSIFSCALLKKESVSGGVPVFSKEGKILRYYPYQIRWIGFGESEFPDMTRLVDFKNLSSLEISHPEFQNLEELSSLKTIGFLNVSGTKVKDLSVLSKLPVLHSLYLNKTFVDEQDLKRYPGVGKLTKLGLYKTKIRDLSFIGSECRLQQLDIRNTEVSSLEPIANCRNLLELRIGHTHIKEIRSVYEMRSLRYLEWSGLDLSRKELDLVRKQLPYLKLVPIHVDTF